MNSYLFIIDYMDFSEALISCTGKHYKNNLHDIGELFMIQAPLSGDYERCMIS